MWSCPAEAIAGGAGQVCRPQFFGEPVTYAQAIRLWQGDDAFPAFLTDLIAAAPYASLRWECLPVAATAVSAGFEFVLLDAPELRVAADPVPFRQQLGGAALGALVRTFRNLSGDALLVVPRAIGPPQAYAEFAGFLRGAPPAQIRALWAAVGAAMQVRLGPAPVWLSTAGAGVAWVHVRLDSRPKYYGHEPYRRWPPCASLAATRPRS